MSTIKVTLTDEEVDQRRAHFCRARQRARLQPIPQHVLDYLLPRVRVEQYADEEGNVLGECWIWLQQTVPGSGTPRGNVGNRTVALRRWIAEQMRVKPIPAKWVTLVTCNTKSCAHPHCCLPMSQTKAMEWWREHRAMSNAVLRQRVLAGRARSSMDDERVQRMRDEHAAARDAGVRLTLEELGRRYGITGKAAGDIIRGKRWAPGNQVMARRVASVFDLGRLAA